MSEPVLEGGSTTEAVVEFRDVTKVFHARQGLLRTGALTWAMRNVSFAVGHHEVFALVGESGAGKTTAGRVALGLEVPDQGQVLFEGTDLASLSSRRRLALRRRTHFILQDPYQSLHPAMSVEKLVGEPLAITGVPSRDRRPRVEEALHEVRLTPPFEFLDVYPHELSGGQRQRVAFARALAARPRLIVADEPVSMLDVSLQAGILELVEGLSAEHSIIFITHDLPVARYIADRIGVMYEGRLVEVGDADAVVEKSQHPYTRALLAAAEELAAPPPEPGPFPPGGQPCQLHGLCAPTRTECREAVPVLVDVGPAHRCACHITNDLEPVPSQ